MYVSQISGKIWCESVMRPAVLPLRAFPAWWEKSRTEAGACCCWEVWNWLCPWQGDGEKHGVLWLLWTLALLINTFPLAYSQSVDPCKEAEPKSILLKPIKSLIQWTIEHQLLSLSPHQCCCMHTLTLSGEQLMFSWLELVKLLKSWRLPRPKQATFVHIVSSQRHVVQTAVINIWEALWYYIVSSRENSLKKWIILLSEQ